MSDHLTQLALPLRPPNLQVQMLRWIAERPRSYAETMDAWRTSCPRLSVWEDAVADELVSLDTTAPNCGQSDARVRLTERGCAVLALASG